MCLRGVLFKDRLSAHSHAISVLLARRLCRKAYVGIFHVHALIAHTKVSCKFNIHYPRILLLRSAESRVMQIQFALLIVQLLLIIAKMLVRT